MFDMTFIYLVGLYMLAFVISIAAHEAAHAYTAHFFGDRTPQMRGRLTLNPFAHLSLAGTAFPFLAIILRLPLLFGWGKPVPVDYAQMRWQPFSRGVVAAAGSAANLMLCLTMAIALAFVPAESLTNKFLNIMIALNAMLCIFNLLPLSPLDGATVLTSILPAALRDAYDDYIAPYGLYIFLALMISGQIGWIMQGATFLEKMALHLGTYVSQLF